MQQPEMSKGDTSETRSAFSASPAHAGASGDFLRFADAMPHLVWTARPDGTIEYFNSQIERYAGVHRTEAGTWEWTTALHPDDAVRTAKAWRRAVEAGTPYEVEHRAHMADGSYRWHVSRALPVRDADERIERWCGTATDIHRLKEFERALLQSEEQFRALFMETRDAILLADDDGVYRDANPAATAILGYDREELLTMTVGDLSDTDEETFRAMWNDFLHDGRMQGNYRLQTKQGKPIVVEFNAVTNVLPGLHLSTLRDVTERVQAEAALQESEHRVRELARSLTLAEQHERRRIAYVLHEDLQQLLSGIRMLVPSRPDMPLPADRIQTLHDMLSRAVEVTRTLSHELNPPLRPDENFGDLLRWIAEEGRKRHNLHVDIESYGSIYVADEALRVLLSQLLRELLFNVVKHAETKRARIVARRLGSSILISVEDEGAGFDPTVLETDGTTGLGLAAVRERLELVGGDVMVASEPGHGTSVTIVIPAEPDS
jgi:PAS domain S-box-containing protein